MAKSVAPIDFGEIQALVEMTRHADPLIANIAISTLAVVESRRDAEIRAATATAALEAQADAIRRLLALPEAESDPAAILRDIAAIVGAVEAAITDSKPSPPEALQYRRPSP